MVVVWEIFWGSFFSLGGHVEGWSTVSKNLALRFGGQSEGEVSYFAKTSLKLFLCFQSEFVFSNFVPLLLPLVFSSLPFFPDLGQKVFVLIELRFYLCL